MIIQNGTLKFKLKSQTEMDPETGYPIPPQVTWTEPIPCQFFPVSIDLHARVGSENRARAQYTVLIEGPALSESIGLTDRDGRHIGEFTAISVEPLDAVGQTKIVI